MRADGQRIGPLRFAVLIATLANTDNTFWYNCASLHSLPEFQAVNHERIIQKALANTIREVKRDKRTGSKPGRRKKLKRISCNWHDQYLSQNAVYDSKTFKDRFGIPKSVFHFIHDTIKDDIYAGPAADGTPGMPTTLALMASLRILRTGMILSNSCAILSKNNN